MRWIGDVQRGEWLKERLDQAWRDMHIVVPHGYEAYARVFHPLSRDRPADTKSWHGRSTDSYVDLDNDQATWHTTAEAFGTQMHALAQFHRLVGTVPYSNETPLDAAGWRYFEPAVGNLDIDVLAAVAAHLVNNTSTPDTGVAAIWEGWGGLTSAAGYAELTLETDDDGKPTRLTTSSSDSSVPGTGLLSAEVAQGPKLELPDRSYFLFESGATTFTDESWTSQAPWVDHSWSPQSPSIIWPDDRSWVVVTEIDYDSTIVAGSLQLTSDLCRDPKIEALIIREGADLTWDADVVNRPPG